jgi:hypothetical protein
MMMFVAQRPKGTRVSSYGGRFQHDEDPITEGGKWINGGKVEVPMVAVVQIEGDKIACERIYWDQASVLVQIGLLNPHGLPVAGVASARKFEDQRLPSNELIRR